MALCFDKPYAIHLDSRTNRCNDGEERDRGLMKEQIYRCTHVRRITNIDMSREQIFCIPVAFVCVGRLVFCFIFAGIAFRSEWEKRNTKHEE